MTRRIETTVVAALILSVAGAAQAQDNDVVIGLSMPSLDGGQAQIQAGMVAAAEAKGWEILTTTSGGDPQKQRNDINDFITQQVDAIVAVPDDSAGICLAVEDTKDAGIPFFTIDRSPIGCEIHMTVLSDNFMAGQQSAEAVVDFLTERYGEPRGKVLEITGNLAQNVAQLRGGGFNEVLSRFPGIEVITRVGDWDSVKGGDIVRDVATSEADLDAIYSHSDCVNRSAVLQTLDEIGRLVPRGEEGHIHLSAVDACTAALESIRDGSADQASNQPIPDFGILAADFIELVLEGGTIEPQELVQEGALWSPARVEDSDVGPQLFLATSSVGPGLVDVNDPRLWGNIVGSSQ